MDRKKSNLHSLLKHFLKEQQENVWLNWNSGHIVAFGSTVTLATLLVFQASSGTLEASADMLAEKPELMRSHVVAYDVAYNDVNAIAEVAKVILEDQINPLSMPKLICETFDRYVYECDDYVIEIFFNPNQGLGKHEVKMTVQTKSTYAHSNIDKIDAQNDSYDTNIVEGMVFTYYPTINVVDKSAPVFKQSRKTVVIDDTDDFDIHDYISAKDLVDGKVDLKVKGMFKEIERGRYQAGKYTLTVSASDSNGNTATTKLNVEVKDTRVKKQTYGNYKGSPYAGNVVAEARAQIGKPYVWGAEGPYAFDCSGLVKYVYGRAGVSLPHGSESQFNCGVAINPNDRSAWRAGDIVLYNGHVAIYSGNNTLIHALNESVGVLETRVGNYNGPVIAVRRILQ